MNCREDESLSDSFTRNFFCTRDGSFSSCGFQEINKTRLGATYCGLIYYPHVGNFSRKMLAPLGGMGHL